MRKLKTILADSVFDLDTQVNAWLKRNRRYDAISFQVIDRRIDGDWELHWYAFIEYTV